MKIEIKAKTLGFINVVDMQQEEIFARPTTKTFKKNNVIIEVQYFYKKDGNDVVFDQRSEVLKNDEANAIFANVPIPVGVTDITEIINYVAYVGMFNVVQSKALFGVPVGGWDLIVS